MRRCSVCQNLTETEICRVCSDPKRDASLLCVVESPADVLAIEQAGGFRGYYFVLHGRLSPIDGIGPEQLGLDNLQARIRQIRPEELILATNPTVEGEATAHFISRMIADDVKQISRIAHGVRWAARLNTRWRNAYAVGRRNVSLWIETDQALAEAVASWDDCVGLDTEFIRTATFYPIPGLYQVASDTQIFLLDPLTIEDWRPFNAYLTDPSKVKVMHACQEDLELIKHHLGINPVNIFDTQFANAFVGQDFSLSYANLVRKLVDVDLQKQETRSNWLQRPLSEEQMIYAADDVIYLVPMSGPLVCIERQWSFDLVLGRHGSSGLYVEPIGEYFAQVKRAWQLSPRELARLKSLCRWRENAARLTSH